jgi:acetylornithine deacetylase/succinyl-diaminopimelate desuccinylase family protein
MDLVPLDILRQLVSIPSANPMGRADDSATRGEARLTDFLERLFRDLGMRTARQEVLPGRENLYALLEGLPPEHGGLLLFDAHQDTVPGEGMAIAPWTPDVRDGRLYGRGACDTKGGMAAMIAALARLARENPADRPAILMACTVDEEYHLSGAPRLASLWQQGSDPLIPRIPDAVLVAEPTGLDVIVAHKGLIRWTCSTRGRAAHSSQPDRGDNAVYKMARLVTAVERYSKEVVPRFDAHPLCGGYTLNVGTIHGGTAINVVPDRCCVELEIRVPPGGDPESARDDLIRYLERQESIDFPIEHDPPYMQGLPLNDDANRRLASQLQESIHSVAGTSRCRGVPYATNAAFYARAGVPAVVFGPGDIVQAHTADEWISVEQLRQAAEIFYCFAKSFRRGRPQP